MHQEISLQEYSTLERLALNPHYKMSKEQLDYLERGRRKYDGRSPRHSSAVDKHDFNFEKRAE